MFHETVRSKELSGFSLVEMLTAVAAAAFVIVTLGTFLSTLGNNWKQNSSQSETLAEAGPAFETMIRDLESMIRDGAGGEYFVAKSGLWVPETTAPSSFKNQLLFFSPVQDRPRPAPVAPPAISPPSGDVCAISYRLIVEDPISPGGGFPRTSLYRMVASPEDTFATALQAADIWGTFWDPLEALHRNPDHLLALDVVSFELRIMYRDAVTDLLVALPPEHTVRMTNTAVTVVDESGTPAVTGFSSPAQLEAIEVTIGVIDRAGASLLRDGSITSNQAIEQFGRKFSSRIELPKQVNL